LPRFARNDDRKVSEFYRYNTKTTLMKKKIVFILINSIMGIILANTIPPLSHADLESLGKRIWQNEASQKIDLLTFWNQHEPFPSFGIGHFIWFPQKYKGPYTQTFPHLLVYLKKSGVSVPSWLIQARWCPWSNRNIFYEQFNSTKIQELRTLLIETVAQQTSFIIHNLTKTIHKITAQTPRKTRKKIMHNFHILSQTRNGLYALIDYHNFKGAGTNLQESYDGHRWGLLQVLQIMESPITPQSAVESFVNAAKKLLTDRVECAPTNKPEKQFLTGWHKRLETYLVY
jgi:hypothetical protein